MARSSGLDSTVTEAPLRVLLVADDPLARVGLASMLSDEERLVVKPMPVQRQALRLALEARDVDVVVVDLGADASGAAELLESLPRSDVPVLALFGEGVTALDVIHGGANALLPRDIEPVLLAAAIVATARGLTVMDRGSLLALAPQREARDNSVEGLTPRETEVLALMAEGLSNKRIAERLDISEHTAKFHVNAILAKLGVQRRTEAVTRAIRLGLLVL